MGYGMMGYGLMGFGMLIPILLVALIIYAIARLTGSNSTYHKSQHYQRNDALDVLNQRYAKGEISDEEYKHKKAMLKD